MPLFESLKRYAGKVYDRIHLMIAINLMLLTFNYLTKLGRFEYHRKTTWKIYCVDWLLGML